MSIYVETRIRGRLDDIWQRTQDPALHERWDLRFSEIAYLPRDGDEPQRFRYKTVIGFGLCVRGEGESSGTRDAAAGERTSALRFWSDDPKSLIREGSGYWRYISAADGVRFLTWYDYRTRFGALGRLLDRVLFRPLMGWATAWSFDRLRLWIEQGIDPALSMQRSLAHAAARIALAIVFLHQGLVPKLLYRHPSELRMLSEAGLSVETAGRVLVAVGVAEVALGAVLLLAWRARWPFILILALMPVSLIGVAITSPGVLVGAFNPVALNVAVAALAAVGWLMSAGLPSAAHCLRARPVEGLGAPA
jgi:DoxX-like protein